MNIPLVIQLFVLINPLSSFPFLISAQEKGMNIRKIAIRAVITAFIVAFVMALIGVPLFGLFGISTSSFRVAGGIVLIVLAYQMVRPSPEKKDEIKDVDAVTTLIATPMLTGPATISFITIKTMEEGFASFFPNLIISFVLVGIVFYFFSLLVKKIDAKIVNILSRILGLFLMAVAVDMIFAGIKGIIG